MSSISSISNASSYWPAIRDSFSNAFNEIEEGAETVGEAVSDAYDTVETTVKSVALTVEEVVDDGVDAVKEAWETFGNAIDTFA